MANTFLYPAPDSLETLYIPSGTALTVLWTCSFDSIDLLVFQLRSDGSYGYSILLSDVSIPPGNGSYAWQATSVDTGSTEGMHFEVTLASNGQSLDGFNSGLFYINHGSAISTSFASSSTTSLVSSTTSFTSSTFSSPLANTSTVVTTTGSPTASPTGNSQEVLKLGLGLGLGLGIPFLLLLIGVLGFAVMRRGRREKQDPPVPQDMYYVPNPTEYHKNELPVREQRHELRGAQPVYEVPS